MTSTEMKQLFTAADEMERVWGTEWEGLATPEALLILFDFLSAACSADEYRRRIGEGNLIEYVACLRRPT